MIWQRYLFFRLVKSFLFILGAVFAVYSIVDLATRSGKFFRGGLLPDVETLLYYTDQLSTLLSLFFVLAFLLASIQVLLDLNSHYELVALQMGGLSLKKLLAPFFALAGLLFLLSLANHQWVSPLAQKNAESYVAAHAKKKKRQVREHVHTIGLKDGTELIYQSFDEKKGELFDVFWIESPSKIWHIKWLEVHPPAGRFVDCFQRNGDHLLEKIESFEKRVFPEIDLDTEAVFKPFISFESRSLSQLTLQVFARTAEGRSLLAHLLYKLAQPLLLFLIPLIIGPVACRFSRDKPAFLIVACSLFGFVAMMTILDGMLILGENQVIPASLALLGPLALLLIFSYRPFQKL